MDDLGAAIASLRISIAQRSSDHADETKDGNTHTTSLTSQPVRNIRRKLSADELKKQLEEEFLTPSPRFNSKWLDELQRWVALMPIIPPYDPGSIVGE